MFKKPEDISPLPSGMMNAFNKTIDQQMRNYDSPTQEQAEAATRVVMNLPQEDLPQEDLHEGYGHPDIEMKKVVSYLESFLKNVKQDSDIDFDDADDTHMDVQYHVLKMGNNLNRYDPKHSLILAQWAILGEATLAITDARGVSNSLKSIVKRRLDMLKTIAKIKV